VFGLGNPGEKYAATRHNAGFEVLNRVAIKCNQGPVPGKGDYYILEKVCEGTIVRLVWPMTYMNRSGQVVAEVMERYELTSSNIAVVYDDFNLPMGSIRIRLKGSAGGHNGMESIIEEIGSEDFVRLRLGIGPVPDKMDPADYVLGRISPEEEENYEKMLGKGSSAVLYLLNNRPEEAMTIYNRTPASDESETE